MKNIKGITIIFLLVLAKNANANDIQFGWNIGNIRFSYDVLKNKPNFEPFGLDCEILYFNWLFRNTFSFGFNVLDINFGEEIGCTILPVEIAYVPLHYKDLFVARV